MCIRLWPKLKGILQNIAISKTVKLTSICYWYTSIFLLNISNKKYPTIYAVYFTLIAHSFRTTVTIKYCNTELSLSSLVCKLVIYTRTQKDQSSLLFGRWVITYDDGSVSRQGQRSNKVDNDWNHASITFRSKVKLWWTLEFRLFVFLIVVRCFCFPLLSGEKKFRKVQSNQSSVLLVTAVNR